MNELEVLRGLVSSSEGPLGVIGILLSIALVLFMLRRPVKPPSGEGAKATPHHPLSRGEMEELMHGAVKLQAPQFEIIQQLIPEFKENTEAITGLSANVSIMATNVNIMASNVEKVVMAVIGGNEKTQGLIRSEGHDTRQHFDDTITPLVKAIHDLTDEIRAMRADLNPPPPQAPKVIALDEVVKSGEKKKPGRPRKNPPKASSSLIENSESQEKVA